MIYGRLQYNLYLSTELKGNKMVADVTHTEVDAWATCVGVNPAALVAPKSSSAPG